MAMSPSSPYVTMFILQNFNREYDIFDQINKESTIKVIIFIKIKNGTILVEL